MEQSSVVQHEMEFMQGVRFNLTLHHPYRPLRGLMAKFKDTAGIRLRASAGAAIAPEGTAQDQAAGLEVPLPAWRELHARARLLVMHSLVRCSAA